MAVTVEDLGIALRLSPDGTGIEAGQLAVITRLLGVGEAHTELLIPSAPDAIKDECIVRMSTYIYDQPPAGRRDAYANSWVNSGAGALASRWNQQAVSGSNADALSGGVSGGLTLAQVQELIAQHRNVVAAHHEPSVGGGVHLLTAVPAASFGVDGETALVRVSSIVVHAYRKVAGAWVRQWAFSGGDSVLLAGSLAAIPDRRPATDPDGTTFTRYVGMSGYNPVTQADIDDAHSNINSLAGWRGGNHGTQTGARANTLPNQQFGSDLEDYTGLTFGAATPIYLWFGINASESEGLSISSVSYDGVEIPVTKQADQIVLSGNNVDVWVADTTRTWAEIKDHPFILTVVKDAAFPNTYNRYAVVTGNPVPSAADFLSDDANASASISILIPNAGWVNGRGYLHFALPSTQDAPTVAGLPGGINLIDDFTIRSTVNTVTINGDTMRTLSSDSEVFQMTDLYSLFAWIVA